MSTETTMRGLVAEEIRALLARRKLSASELARQLGMTQRYISRRLTGETPFDVDDLARVATLLNVEVGDLLPRGTEGRTVVIAGASREKTTRAYPRPTVQPTPPGRTTRAVPPPSTRRPVRVTD